MDLKPQVLQILVSLMLAQARECLYEKLLLQLEHFAMKDDTHVSEYKIISLYARLFSFNSYYIDQMHRDLSGEAAQLTMEYTEIHNCIQTDDIHTFIPECWAGFVPLKSEYYKAVAHYHAAKSISPSRPDEIDASSSKGKTRIDTVQQQNNFVFDETSLDSDVCPTALKMAHVKESLACHDEAQRLQRMCRDLKVLI